MAKATKVPALGAFTPLRTAGPLLLEARLADVRRHEAAFSGEGEPPAEAVHDMRVAARRLRVALRLLGDERLQALEAQVKALQDALGAVRDVHVHGEWVAGRAGGAELAQRLDAERAAVEKQLYRQLVAWTSATAPTLGRLALRSGGRGRLGGAGVAKQVRRAIDRLARRQAQAAPALEPENAHQLRIAAKKLRYLVELASPGHRGPARRLLGVLEPFLDRIGELHDRDVRAGLLERLAAQAIPPAERAAARALVAAERQGRAEEARALRQELARWRSEDFLGAARRAFAKRRRTAALKAFTDRHRPSPPPSRAAASQGDVGHGDHLQ